ncbi:MAG: zinc metallopeptidase [Clostridia bacterium]|nr:zinc metallopeptidase [Clostridia bacterium]
MLFYFGFDWTYIIIVLPAIILSIWASARVNTTFEKYAKVKSHYGITGARAARRMLDENGLQHVKIERVGGKLTDHYDPRTNVIRLSASTHDNTSPAAIGVAMHEAGHALQYAQNYKPIKIRQAIIPVTNIGSRLAIPLILIGTLLSGLSGIYSYFALAGVVLYSFCVLFQLATLPVEFNASKRAVKALENTYMLADDEIPIVKKVLSAAAMTYVAALAVSLAQLLRLFMLVTRTNRRR